MTDIARAIGFLPQLCFPVFINIGPVPFSCPKSNGFPDFTPYVQKVGMGQTWIKLSGNRKKDEKLSNLQTFHVSTPATYTWHHHEAIGIMQLVEKQYHQKVQHQGGVFMWMILKNRDRYG